MQVQLKIKLLKALSIFFNLKASKIIKSTLKVFSTSRKTKKLFKKLKFPLKAPLKL